MTPSSVRLLALSLLLAACDKTASGNVVAGSSPDRAVPLMASAISTPATRQSAVKATAPGADNVALTNSHATIVTELRKLLVGKGTFDHATITAIDSIDACRIGVTTAKGVTVIDWSKAGNIAPRDEAGQEINDVPAADGAHPLAVPAGDIGDSVSGAVGLLTSECAG